MTEPTEANSAPLAPAAPAKKPVVATATIGAAAAFTLLALLRLVTALVDAARFPPKQTSIAIRAAFAAGAVNLQFIAFLALIALGAYAGWRKVAPMLGGGGPTSDTDKQASVVAGVLAGTCALTVLVDVVALFGVEEGDRFPVLLTKYAYLIEAIVVLLVVAAGAYGLGKSLRPPRAALADEPPS